MGPSRPLFRLFSSFQTHIAKFTTKRYVKMRIQYTVPGFELTTLNFPAYLYFSVLTEM